LSEPKSIGARIVDRMNKAAAEITEFHEGFQGTLADATCAALHLVLDPENDDAEGQLLEVWDFIQRSALPHMEFEEAVLYPRAVARGVPELCIDALKDEHDALRRVASLLSEMVAGDVGHEQALLLLQFLQMFDKHANREEAVLALFDERLTSH
jgi:hemerythrin-like domain-containing protein